MGREGEETDRGQTSAWRNKYVRCLFFFFFCACMLHFVTTTLLEKSSVKSIFVYYRLQKGSPSNIAHAYLGSGRAGLVASASRQRIDERSSKRESQTRQKDVCMRNSRQRRVGGKGITFILIMHHNLAASPHTSTFSRGAVRTCSCFRIDRDHSRQRRWCPTASCQQQPQPNRCAEMHACRKSPGGKACNCTDG